MGKEIYFGKNCHKIGTYFVEKFCLGLTVRVSVKKANKISHSLFYAQVCAITSINDSDDEKDNIKYTDDSKGEQTKNFSEDRIRFQNNLNKLEKESKIKEKKLDICKGKVCKKDNKNA